MRLKNLFFTLLMSASLYADDTVQINDKYLFKLDKKTQNGDLLESSGIYAKPVAKREEDGKRFYILSGNSPSFSFIDYDTDGLNDLITSSNGLSYFHRNTGQKNKNGFPIYENGIELKMRLPFVPNNGSCSVFIDADDDGYVDILSSRADGSIYFYKNLAKESNK